ncbi:AMP-binding protein [Corynebacterium aquatimens]|uniref:Acyl-CoA synthetase (AMP-forming)/AMP-acid ligase II n=1 Tax=Corynebacterium aquatimens TaxID=1190508 RepID=A0A931GTU4_9CORY|nr:AMP-binding protein [Corynebacterium aquatimens]MBG6122145.1 acyl-CoA synthetase (AMP-forming)/AMP-acid ligase II [Corynebacterium aquatimens]WJY65314.1 Long-chain-fatty-acid--CoA ligase [Corynebacterium aquatimens]
MAYSSHFPDIDIPEISIYEAVFNGLNDEDAQRPAITELTTGKTVTYGELRTMADAIAGYLASKGLGPGNVVTLQIPNSIHFASTLLGIFRAGCTVNPVGVLLTAEDVDKVADMAGADLFIGVTDVGHHSHIWEEELDDIVAQALPAPNLTVDPSSVASIPFSSGTTGLPKGVELTHRNLVANMHQAAFMFEANGVEEYSKILAPLPFSHIYGMTALLLGALLKRWHIHTLPKFDPEVFLGAHAKCGIQLTFIAPPMAVMLAKHPAVDPAWFTALKRIVCGAAPLDTDVARAVEQRLDCSIIQGYGMTESSPITHVGIMGEVPPGSVGYAAPNTNFRIVDIDTIEDVEEGEAGELLIQGPQVMKGYLNNEEATRETLLDGGWLRTGDVARLDEKGHLYLVDRAKEVIKYKGYQVAPAELEALLLTHEAIADAGVVGVDRDGLEIPRAFVVLQEGASISEEELMEWVAERVTPYKKIRAVTFIDEIPKNPTGKILRKNLRDIPLED